MRPKTYMLAKAIQERKDILFGNIDAMFKPQGLKEKEEAWEAVRNEMIECGFINFERKSWKDVRNHDWQYLRRSAVAKFEHNQKPGSEPIQYSEVDKIVFDIMGNEASYYNDNVYDADSKTIEVGPDNVFMENLLSGVLKHESPLAASSSLADSKQNDKNNNNSHDGITDEVNTPKLQSLFNSMVHRKLSWDTNSSNESNNQNSGKEHAKEKNSKSGNGNDADAVPDYSKLLTISPNTLTEGKATGSGQNMLCQLEFLNSLNNLGMFEKSTISPGNQMSSRKRPFPVEMLSKSKTVEDEIQEAKLQLLLIQIRREEVLIQQEQAKVEQEQAKARQEILKVELLETELAKKRHENLTPPSPS